MNSTYDHTALWLRVREVLESSPFEPDQVFLRDPLEVWCGLYLRSITSEEAWNERGKLMERLRAAFPDYEVAVWETVTLQPPPGTFRLTLVFSPRQKEQPAD